MNSDISNLSSAVSVDGIDSFIIAFETIVLKARQNIIVKDFENIRDFILKTYGQSYNNIFIIEVDLFADTEREREREKDCIDQILKAVKDSLEGNEKIKNKFEELFVPGLKEIQRDDIYIEIFNELMSLKNQVILIIESFNYWASHISDNDYHRLTNLCKKKYPEKLSLVLVIDNKQSFNPRSYEMKKFLSTFESKYVPILSTNPADNIMYQPFKDNITMNIPEIYISYAWTNESEVVLTELRSVLEENNITYYVDKKDVDYRGNIREFEERLGKGNYIILIVSDKFLKSKDCMFEIQQILQNGGDIVNRIYPIVLPDAKIYEPEERIDYIKHWEDKKDSLNAKLKTIGAEDLSGLRFEIDNYSKFRNIIDQIITILKEMNNLSPDIHRDSKFIQLINSLKEQSQNTTVANPLNTLNTSFAIPQSKTINQYGSKSIYIDKNDGNITIQ